MIYSIAEIISGKLDIAYLQKYSNLVSEIRTGTIKQFDVKEIEGSYNNYIRTLFNNNVVFNSGDIIQIDSYENYELFSEYLTISRYKHELYSMSLENNVFTNIAIIIK